MIRISSDLLADTLNLVQLARETALARGNQDQAKRLNPVVNQLNNLVSTAPAGSTPPSVSQVNPEVTAKSTPAVKAGLSPAVKPEMAGMEGFNTLLQVARQASQSNQPVQIVGSQSRSSLERMNMVQAMADGKMKDTEIARQMGMTLEEVQMVIKLRQNSATHTVLNGNRGDL